MGPKSGFVQANGIKLHYLDWGGKGAPLVTTHGTSMLGAAWIPAAQYLAPHFRVIALDMRGHGDSEKPDWGYTWGTLGKDFAAFLEAMGLTGVYAVGHSRGGSTVITGAPHCAGRLAGVMLIEPSILMRSQDEIAGGPSSKRSLEMAETARKRRAVFDSREQAFGSYHDRGMFKGWPDENLRIFLQHALADRPDGKVELKCPPDIEGRFYVAPVDVDVVQSMTCITCPTKLVWGTESERFTTALPMVAAFIDKTHCETGQVPGGHFSVVQHPREVAESVLAFGRSIGLAE